MSWEEVMSWTQTTRYGVKTETQISHPEKMLDIQQVTNKATSRENHPSDPNSALRYPALDQGSDQN